MRYDMDRSQATSDRIVAISERLDWYLADLDPLALDMVRTMKVTEEAGEAYSALIDVKGLNPRRPPAKDIDDVKLELIDVAITALAAFEHFDHHSGTSLEWLYLRARAVRDRLPGPE